LSRIGFFGGSFNPPTIAHLEIVKTALNEFNLDRIIVVPMGDKYDKKELIPFKYRYRMLEIMFEEYDNVEISSLQVNQQERSYAIDTFEIIDEKYNNDERFFIMGLDNFVNIKKWKSSEKLLENRKYIVFKRNSVETQILNKSVQYFDVDKNISSTMARNRIKSGKDLTGVLENSVIDYINKNGLYK
jgi:nicotinate-nucleotide adenylyltransferase